MARHFSNWWPAAYVCHIYCRKRILEVLWMQLNSCTCLVQFFSRWSLFSRKCFCGPATMSPVKSCTAFVRHKDLWGVTYSLWKKPFTEFKFSWKVSSAKNCYENLEKTLKYTFLTKDLKHFQFFSNFNRKPGNIKFFREFLCRHFWLEFTWCSFRWLGCKICCLIFCTWKTRRRWR